MVETNEAKDCYEKCHCLTISAHPQVCIVVNKAELWSCEITYRIIDGICNQHYDNQRGHQVENTLEESEKPQSKVIFIHFKKGGGGDNNNGVKIQAVNTLKYGSFSHKIQLIWKAGPQKFENTSHLFWHYWVKTTVWTKQVGNFFKICDLLIISKL